MVSLKAPVIINVDFNPHDLVKSIGNTHLEFLCMSTTFEFPVNSFCVFGPVYMEVGYPR